MASATALVSKKLNGIIKSIGSYLSSKKINTWTYFYNNGNIRKIENYALPYTKLNQRQLPLLEGPYSEFHKNGEKNLMERMLSLKNTIKQIAVMF